MLNIIKYQMQLNKDWICYIIIAYFIDKLQYQIRSIIKMHQSISQTTPECFINNF